MSCSSFLLLYALVRNSCGCVHAWAQDGAGVGSTDGGRWVRMKVDR